MANGEGGRLERCSLQSSPKGAASAPSPGSATHWVIQLLLLWARSHPAHDAKKSPSVHCFLSTALQLKISRRTGELKKDYAVAEKIPANFCRSPEASDRPCEGFMTGLW